MPVSLRTNRTPKHIFEQSDERPPKRAKSSPSTPSRHSQTLTRITTIFPKLNTGLYAPDPTSLNSAEQHISPRIARSSSNHDRTTRTSMMDINIPESALHAQLSPMDTRPNSALIDSTSISKDVDASQSYHNGRLSPKPVQRRTSTSKKIRRTYLLPQPYLPNREYSIDIINKINNLLSDMAAGNFTTNTSRTQLNGSGIASLGDGDEGPKYTRTPPFLKSSTETNYLSPYDNANHIPEKSSTGPASIDPVGLSARECADGSNTESDASEMRTQSSKEEGNAMSKLYPDIITNKRSSLFTKTRKDVDYPPIPSSQDHPLLEILFGIVTELRTGHDHGYGLRHLSPDIAQHQAQHSHALADTLEAYTSVVVIPVNDMISGDLLRAIKTLYTLLGERMTPLPPKG